MKLAKKAACRMLLKLTSGEEFSAIRLFNFFTNPENAMNGVALLAGHVRHCYLTSGQKLENALSEQSQLG
jgi:hypothetical protein